MWHRLWVWLRAFVRPGATLRDVDEELQLHLAREIERNITRGASPEEARPAATRAFGSAAAPASVTEPVRLTAGVVESLGDVGDDARRHDATAMAMTSSITHMTCDPLLVAEFKSAVPLGRHARVQRACPARATGEVVGNPR